MKRLVAHYDLRLIDGIVIKRAEDDLPSYTTTIDNFDVVISLLPESTGGKKTQGERYFTRDCTRLQVTCARDEDDAPPPPVPTPNGGRNYAVQTDYFEQHGRGYASASTRALNRFFDFLRYSLHQPFFHLFRAHDDVFLNPTWRDEDDNKVGHGALLFVAQPLPTRFGVIPLRKSHDAQIRRRLSSAYLPELYEDFLADAQAAAFDGNVRRAVVELAIACEVATKHTFFGKTSPGALTIEHLEDKHVLRLHVVELIHSTSKEVFGASFRDMHEAEYLHIEEVFRCRNKIVHRGRPIYKDQLGTLHQATIDTCEEWFRSVRVMVKWLKGLRL